MSVSTNQVVAFFRSNFPEISLDSLSEKLCSTEGRIFAQQHAQMYPLGGFHVSLRSRYFLESVLKRKNKNHDAYVSIGSGLSLLSYQLAEKIGSQWKYFDSDLPDVITERVSAISTIADQLPVGKKLVTTTALNIEDAAKANTSLADFFPCSCPIVVMEGVSYYVSPKSVKWLASELSKLSGSVLIMDYWPHYAKESSVFQKITNSIDQDSKESVHTFFDQNEILKVLSPLRILDDVEIRDIEKAIAKTERMAELSQILAARFVTAEASSLG
jgi:O-methyltransferase involved in polyketide biosynthesis